MTHGMRGAAGRRNACALRPGYPGFSWNTSCTMSRHDDRRLADLDLVCELRSPASRRGACCGCNASHADGMDERSQAGPAAPEAMTMRRPWLTVLAVACAQSAALGDPQG